MHTSCLLIAMVVLFDPVFSAKILGLFPYKGKSHALVMIPLMEKLAERGHEVTVYGFMKPEKPNKNYTSFIIPTKEIGTVGFLSVDLFTKWKNLAYGNMILQEQLGHEFPEVFSVPELLALSNERKYDLVISEYFNTDLFLAIIYKMRTPFALFHTAEPIAWHRGVFGDPDETAYHPHVFSDLIRGYSFAGRLKNALETFGLNFYYERYMRSKGQALAEKYLGPLPPLEKVARNASLYLVNSHFTINGMIPMNPGTIEVAGIHVKPKNALSKDLQKLLDDAKDGAIYFSMGSVLKGSSFSQEKKEAILKVFSELKQIVLWKYEDQLENKPKNVHVSPWFPQRDILAHPNVKLFIAHCGILGVHEAVIEAVPMICMPMFGDQHFNSRAIQSKGFAGRLDYATLTEQSLRETVNDVLNNPKYKTSAQEVSAAFKDRPMSPMDTAVYWVEYVIRHKGAPQLRSPARDLTWYEYHNLDVWATICGAVLLILTVIFKVMRAFLSFFFVSSKEKQKIS